MPWDFEALDPFRKAALIGFIRVRIEAERKERAKMKKR